MGLFSAVRRAFAPKAKSAAARFFEYADLPDLFGTASVAGPAVSASTALRVTTVFACVRAIADGVGQAPLQVYRRTGDGRGKEAAADLGVYRVLNRRPNTEQTSIEFRQMLTMHAALTGNGFAYKVVEGGEVRELLPLLPQWVTIRRDASGWGVLYDVTVEGRPLGTFDAARIFHLRHPSWDAVSGLSVVGHARNAIGLSMATEDHHSRLHANGGTPGGILTTELEIPSEEKEKLKTAFQANYGGRNAFKTAVLDRGLKFLPMAATGVDAQHIETRRFQVEEVCRYFNVYPQIVMHADKTATFASAESFFAAHVRQTLGPWFELWEQRLDEYVLDGAGPLFCQFDRRELARAMLKDRSQAYRTFAELGIYTRNEIREMEGLPPLAGLDKPLTPMNMGGDDGVDDLDDEESNDDQTND